MRHIAQPGLGLVSIKQSYFLAPTGAQERAQDRAQKKLKKELKRSLREQEFRGHLFGGGEVGDMPCRGLFHVQSKYIFGTVFFVYNRDSIINRFKCNVKRHLCFKIAQSKGFPN